MGIQVYSKAEFIIIRVSRGFIIINRKKGFKTGHTHIKNFDTAKYLIDLVIHQSIPHHLPPYLLISLAKISDNEVYGEKVRALAEAKNNRKQRYYRSA